MDIGIDRAIRLLKEELDNILPLGQLQHDNEEFKLWLDNVQNIIKAAFPREDLMTFVSTGLPVQVVDAFTSSKARDSRYRQRLKAYSTNIKKIIQKYELLGMEEKPVKNTEQKDTVKFPVQLFDAMQFHPKVVEVSKGCFIAGNYREAILNAFICLIDYVKERTGLDLDGDDLMNQVFSINYDKEHRRITKYPIIRINELQNKSDRDEQQGFMFLCKGAAGGIRNPKAHKLIPQSNPLHTLEYLAFASLLMRRIEEGKVVRTSQSRRKWDWDSFIKDTKEKCEQKIIDLTKNLYDFTSVNSDSISWGTGINDGSFTFRKLSINGEISIFSVYSCGWVYINFGSMINKTVPDSIIETFRTSLNSIPNINIPKSAITDGKYARIYENPLTNFNNLQIFKDAVISLCQQLEKN